jgi:hypothetical protein
VSAVLPPRDTSDLHRTAVRVLTEAVQSANRAAGPEAALACLTRVPPTFLGDRDAHLRPGGLLGEERQFSVCGVFLLTPDRRENLLVAEVGFPSEQHRLRIPSDLGHPGWMVKHKRPLLIENTDDNRDFRQILKTARMGSVMFAPMFVRDAYVGQFILASQARHTYAQADLDILLAFAEAASAQWRAHDGAVWLATLAP